MKQEDLAREWFAFLPENLVNKSTALASQEIRDFSTDVTSDSDDIFNIIEALDHQKL